MLLNYDDYVSMGGTLAQAEYAPYEALSEAELYDIADGALPDTDTVKSCMYIMVSAYQKSDSLTETGKATSYSNDGVSVSYTSYVTPDDLLNTARDRIKLLFANAGIRRYLGVLHRE